MGSYDFPPCFFFCVFLYWRLCPSPLISMGDEFVYWYHLIICMCFLLIHYRASVIISSCVMFCLRVRVRSPIWPLSLLSCQKGLFSVDVNPCFLTHVLTLLLAHMATSFLSHSFTALVYLSTHVTLFVIPGLLSTSAMCDWNPRVWNPTKKIRKDALFRKKGSRGTHAKAHQGRKW